MTPLSMALCIYFIDQYNFPTVCDQAEDGDVVSRDLVKLVMGFVTEAPPPVCSICDKHVAPAKVAHMTIIVMRSDKASLTTWICEDCAVRDDLDRHVARIIREWPEIPRNARIEVLNQKNTLH